ncbi:MAG: hypothetical protein LV479_09355 [Methylacidiphilales bacterium]|nr:hypothetical protein [Candidatus Methylacidiphilales bacterium]
MNLEIYRRILSGKTATVVLSPRALWRLTGADRVRYLNGQVTNDVMALKPGTTGRAAVCTAKGKMEGDLTITARENEFYLEAVPELRESLGARLEKYLIADDAAFEDLSDSWSLSHVFGPTAPAAPEGGFVVAYERFGLPGHDVWTPKTEATVVGEKVEADVVETLRLEHGIPSWGSELTTNTLPPEGGPQMLAAISYSKGCYVGQETIARLKSVGHVNRTLVFLQSDTPSFPAAGTKVAQGEKEIGMVTSGGFSPRRGRGGALAYVPPQAAQAETKLRAGNLELTVAEPLRAGDRL